MSKRQELLEQHRKRMERVAARRAESKEELSADFFKEENGAMEEDPLLSSFEDELDFEKDEPRAYRSAESRRDPHEQPKRRESPVKAFFASAGAAIGGFFGRLFSGKKRGEAETDDTDFDVIDDDFADISGGVDPDRPTVRRGDSKKNASGSSEYFDGNLSPQEESRLFSTQNIPVVPRKVDDTIDKPRRPRRSARDKARESSERTAERDYEWVDIEADEEDEKEERKARFKKGMSIFWKIWKIVRVPIIIAASLLIVYTLLRKVGTKVYNDYLMPVDPNDSTPIVVTIPAGSGASTIAKILYEACGEGVPGLISHKAVFKVYVDFIGKSSHLQAGTYVLSKNMSIPDIVDTICRGMPPREIIRFQVVEGMTIEGMAKALVDQGVLSSPDRFLSLCVTGESFAADHPFINDIPADESGERQFALEGFLFPDTYDIYADSTEETIIDKMLTRFEQIFGPIYRARAQELGLSIYEAVTLASTIEKEAKLSDDFARVAAVFYNRMDRNMSLDSDATLEYVLHTGSLHLTDEQLSTPSGYNTHTNTGLPLGPISNPGDAALNAALYPNAEYRADGYLFFCLMNPENGALVFAKTIEEHNENVARYSPLW